MTGNPCAKRFPWNVLFLILKKILCLTNSVKELLITKLGLMEVGDNKNEFNKSNLWGGKSLMRVVGDTPKEVEIRRERDFPIPFWDKRKCKMVMKIRKYWIDTKRFELLTLNV